MTEFENAISHLAKNVKMTRNKYGTYAPTELGEDGGIDLEAFAKAVLANRRMLLIAIGSDILGPLSKE